MADFAAKFRRPPTHASFEGVVVPIKGLVECLVRTGVRFSSHFGLRSRVLFCVRPCLFLQATAVMMADTDVLGGSFANCGYVVNDRHGVYVGVGLRRNHSRRV